MARPTVDPQKLALLDWDKIHLLSEQTSMQNAFDVLVDKLDFMTVVTFRRECRKRGISSSRSRARTETKIKAREYTTAEDALLIKERQRGSAFSKISGMTGRSERALRQRFNRLKNKGDAEYLEVGILQSLDRIMPVTHNQSLSTRYAYY